MFVNQKSNSMSVSNTINVAFNKLEEHLSQFYSNFVNVVHANNNNNHSSSSYKDPSQPSVDLIDLTRNHESITSDQMKSYIVAMTSQLLTHGSPRYNLSSLTTSEQIVDATNFINNQLNQPLSELDAKYHTLPNKLEF